MGPERRQPYFCAFQGNRRRRPFSFPHPPARHYHSNGWSLRDLHRTRETPGANRLRDAHAALDTAVRAAYAMTPTEGPLALRLRLKLGLTNQ
jgi:hypothetical protein